MTAKQLAELISGREYGLEITTAEAAMAAASGLVVVYGASDDLMEFRGAIEDEAGGCNGASVTVDGQGLIPEYEDIDEDSLNAKDELRDYFERESGGRTIEALWSQGGYSWTYKTDIPHETFEVVDEGCPYCRGIVFSLADCAAGKDTTHD